MGRVGVGGVGEDGRAGIRRSGLGVGDLVAVGAGDGIVAGAIGKVVGVVAVGAGVDKAGARSWSVGGEAWRVEIGESGGRRAGEVGAGRGVDWAVEGLDCAVRLDAAGVGGVSEDGAGIWGLGLGVEN